MQNVNGTGTLAQHALNPKSFYILYFWLVSSTMKRTPSTVTNGISSGISKTHCGIHTIATHGLQIIAPNCMGVVYAHL